MSRKDSGILMAYFPYSSERGLGCLHKKEFEFSLFSSFFEKNEKIKDTANEPEMWTAPCIITVIHQAAKSKYQATCKRNNINHH